MGLTVVNKVYTDLEGRTGNSMQGNYLDAGIVQYDVEYDAKLCLSPYVSVIKKGNTFTLTSGTWYELIGAFKGATIDFIFALTGTAITTTIDYVEGARLALVNGGTSQDGVKSVGYFQVTDAPELFEIDFNLLQNSVGGSKPSVIDGETQRFSATLVNALTVGGGVDNFIQLGNESGGSAIECTIDRITDVAGNKRYTLLVNYKNWVLFDEDRYKADDCIGDYALIRATAQRGNDNVFVEVETKNIGDTGYEDEALNGGANPYTINSLVWTDASANVMEAMDYTQASHIDANILGTFTANHKYGIKLFRLPQDESEYKNKPLNVERNLSLCMNPVLVAESTINSVTGETNEDGAAFDITNFEVIDNTTDIDFSAIITPNAAMIALLGATGATDKDYKLVLVIDDTSAAYRDADTVNLLLDSSNAVKNVIPLGNWPDLVDFDFIGSDGVTLTGTPAPLIESSNRMNVTFTLPKVVAPLANTWLSMTGQIIAEQTSTGDRFAYEAFNYDVSELPTMPDGTLSLDYSQSRGRQLPAASEFNEVTFERNAFLDTGSDFGVSLNYSFQIGYQDWLNVPEVSDYFYGSKNNNWYNVSSDADWTLKFELLLENEDGIYTDAQDFTVTDYGAWTGTVVKTYEDEDANVVTRPLANQINTITAVATGLNPFTGSEFATISMRDKDGAPLWEISTDLDPVVSGNPLQPIAGETRLKIGVVSNVATLECLIDTNLIDVKEYTLIVQFNADV